MSNPKRGFTLIELLIVVAIIAILAAIAVPNFLEAQTRSKVSRAHADMRSYATALESYAVDHGVYPPNDQTATCGPDNTPMARRLSTPISYMTNPFILDPFGDVEDTIGQGFYIVLNSEQADCTAVALFNFCEGTSTPIGTFDYLVDSDTDGFSHGKYLHDSRFSVSSRGPDRVNELARIGHTYGDTGGFAPPYLPDGWATLLIEFSEGGDGIYDPTNGTLSVGELIRNARGLNGGR
jgi:type II secretion system protein G